MRRFLPAGIVAWSCAIGSGANGSAPWQYVSNYELRRVTPYSRSCLTNFGTSLLLPQPLACYYQVARLQRDLILTQLPPNGSSLSSMPSLAVHRDGWKFVAAFAVVTVVLFFVWQPLGWIALAATGWCAYFFRDPPRVTPIRPGLVVSPADGLVVSIGLTPPPPELGMDPTPMLRVGIFLNVFDVHINRVPMDGEVTGLHYTKGRFINASLDKASVHNERMAISMTATGAGNQTIAFVQIAGLVARRIVCRLSKSQRLLAGTRFGLIRFGSRTDVYFPPSWSTQVIVGQKVIGGETVIADALVSEPTRLGSVR